MSRPRLDSPVDVSSDGRPDRTVPVGQRVVAVMRGGQALRRLLADEHREHWHAGLDSPHHRTS